MKIKEKLLLVVLAMFLQAGFTLFSQENEHLKYKNSTFHQAYIPKEKACLRGTGVRNVILLIGDGMGLTHLAAGMYANHNELSITNMPVVGLVKTQSGDKFITDSGASGTAYSTGSKTHNGAIGVDGNDRALKNIPQRIAGIRYSAGVVTTDLISGATPSAFFAHCPARGMSKEILSELPGSELSFVAGGSNEHFDTFFPEYKQKLAERQFTVLNDYREVPHHRQAKKIAVVAYKKDVAGKLDGRDEFLPATTQNAIAFLNGKKKKGFFLMVEGAQIDKRAHENNFAGVIREVLDFDRAVSEALAFADRDGETLILVTADHETGGLSLKGGDIERASMEGNFSTKGHTPVMVPIFAYGPSAERFSGVMENNEVAAKILSLLGAQ